MPKDHLLLKSHLVVPWSEVLQLVCSDLLQSEGKVAINNDCRGLALNNYLPAICFCACRKVCVCIVASCTLNFSVDSLLERKMVQNTAKNPMCWLSTFPGEVMISGGRLWSDGGLWMWPVLCAPVRCWFWYLVNYWEDLTSTATYWFKNEFRVE